MQMLFILTLSGYLTGSLGYLGYLVLHKESFHKVGHWFFVYGLAVHTFLLISSFMETGMVPVENLRATLCFAAWAMAAVFVAFHMRYGLMILGAVVGPLVCAVMLAGSILPAHATVKPEFLKSIWMIFHILAIFIGYGAFVLAAAVGGVYLLQERAIKQKQHGFVFKRLPSLEVLDRMGYACVAFGFPMLTIGMIAGFDFARSVWGSWWNWDPKEVFTFVAWLVYAALLHERLTMGWRGRRAAIMAIIGLAVLLFTFLGVNFLLPGHHGEFTKF